MCLLSLSALEVHGRAAFVAAIVGTSLLVMGSSQPCKDSTGRFHKYTSIHVCAHRSILDLMLLVAMSSPLFRTETLFPHTSQIICSSAPFFFHSPHLLLLCSLCCQRGHDQLILLFSPFLAHHMQRPDCPSAAVSHTNEQ